MEIESAWPKYPDYRIDLVPVPQTARVWFGDSCWPRPALPLLEETRHVDRLYFPHRDVKWEHFTFSEGSTRSARSRGRRTTGTSRRSTPSRPTSCGRIPSRSTRWPGLRTTCASTRSARGSRSTSLGRDDPPGYVRRRVSGVGGRRRAPRADGRGAGGRGPFRRPGLRRDLTRRRRGRPADRRRAIVAACKTVPGQRVTSAFMTFSKSVAHSQSQELSAEVLRAGRSFSTVEVRLEQEGTFRSAALMMLGAGTTTSSRGRRRCRPTSRARGGRVPRHGRPRPGVADRRRGLRSRSRPPGAAGDLRLVPVPRQPCRGVPPDSPDRPVDDPLDDRCGHAAPFRVRRGAAHVDLSTGVLNRRSPSTRTWTSASGSCTRTWRSTPGGGSHRGRVGYSLGTASWWRHTQFKP